MPRPRLVPVLITTALFVLSACTTIAPVGPSGPAASAPGATPLATAIPSLELPTLAPPTDALPTDATPTEEQPTPEPTEEPTATPETEPTPTEPSEPEKANLVPIGLRFDPDEPLPGEEIEATLTIANLGGTEVSLPVAAVLGVEQAGTDGAIAVVNFDGISALAPDDTVELTALFTLPDAGAYRIGAIADADDEVTESNEDDNRLIVDLATATAPNLSIPQQGFYVQPKDDGSGGYSAVVVYENSGTAPLDAPFQIKLFYYTEAGDQGDWGTFDVEQIALAPGFILTAKFDIEVSPGTYLGYALLDPDDTVAETSEDDNEARYDFTAP